MQSLGLSQNDAQFKVWYGIVEFNVPLDAQFKIIRRRIKGATG